ncbi:hypothetical protein A1Q1_01929 [Trichosporon asahii var. asahii CBS 2479]|uniref:DUF6314 domain-containing protein n=1 Tax=Trichosporon asahii var. asahii (strain ATCC 90039 / CBS 2479 / JCM 2466 / KCTC 7840 / NBRC 103889/ NCYC 2677 / UAMH 7654) TaxID=1186058 RepID=J5QTK6_TRIAS|nr:hypothetical protein A1Q1_01929 [Trichosporon asahii var. asahii CBS 2479]EJT49018.1 hypothetical protein A1Q1_01929 [Trichosporon asahii var. asahii CBS 2479]
MALPPAASRPWGTPATVFDRLAGTWQLYRTIEGQAEMRGTASFTALESGMLKYREEGRLRLADGNEFSAHKEYVFERAASGFNVYFAETPLRLFHGITLASDGRSLRGSANHWCQPDTYESQYVFREDGTFTVEHKVRGPHKDYVSVTSFSHS